MAWHDMAWHDMTWHGMAWHSMIKPCMLDCGLVWNAKKCKIGFLKRGKFFDCGKITLEDGMKMRCLEEGETYKFMGIEQSTRLDKDKLEASLSVTVKQRTHVIWHFELYDSNKVLATNIFVNGCIE